MQDFKTVYNRVLKMKAYLFGEQVSLSYPVPEMLNGVRAEKYFLYPAIPAPEKSRPFGVMTVAMENGRLLAYQDCRLEDFVDPEAYGFDRKISYRLPQTMTVQELKVRRSLMDKLYGEVRKMAFTDNLTAEQQEILFKYSVLTDQLVPTDLIPYYVALSRNFIEWRNRYV